MLSSIEAENVAVVNLNKGSSDEPSTAHVLCSLVIDGQN